MATEGPLATGENFGDRYHIIRLLGIGGMGAVYQAWDSELEVALAVKVIRPDATEDPETAAEIERRFKRELLLARQVTHPNVVRIHDLGEIDGIKYITMPYIEGRDLSDILAYAKTLPAPRALAIGKQIVSGLCAAHAAGVVHRDLKPANIMIAAEDRALIMDFGIARSASGPADAGGSQELGARTMDGSATRVGTIVGTIEYMAPEQARGEAVDHRVDIYAFGLIFSRMLVGRRWADGATDPLTDLAARMREAPTPLREVAPDVPEAIDAIISRCVQPDREARYATAVELLEALDKLDENGVPLPEPAPIWRSWKFWTAAASLMTVLVAGTWGIAQWLAPEVPVQRDPVSVLIADFANETGDPMFKGLLEQSLGEGLESAAFVTALDRRNALRVATQLNAGKMLDEKTALVVAQREGVKVLLAGGITPEGTGYKLWVRGVNPGAPSGGPPMLTAEARARNKEDVLPAVGRVAGAVRKSLGDTGKSSGSAEMLSASSLEAMAEYFKGQELTRQGRDDEAIPYFRRATSLDPKFGRAYSAWGTAAFKLGREDEAKQNHEKALSLLDRMTEREKFRTLGVYYLAGAKDYDKAIENFRDLVTKYPSDASGYNNLAVAYNNKLDFESASKYGKKALEIYPNNRLYLSNSALYAMYASDFKTAEGEAKKLLNNHPTHFMGYFPLAMAALDRGDVSAAKAYYDEMGKVSAPALSLATIGLADIAILEGRTREAVDLLARGIAADAAAKREANAAVKRMAVAEAYEAEGNRTMAASAARAAVKGETTEQLLVPAGRIFVFQPRSSDEESEFDQIMDVLANQFEKQKRAYARILDAVERMKRKRYVDAVDELNVAIGFRDVWLARFYLGVAYETAGRHAEAFAEFERCQKRRGEATALFLDEVPTYRYFAPLLYWRARSQEGLGQVAEAKASYSAFLGLKKGPTKDPLFADAQRRLEALNLAF